VDEDNRTAVFQKMTELYHDIARGLLVYRTKEPERIIRHVAEAKRVNGEIVAVPNNLYNCQLLRWLDLPIAPPMVDYDWPCAPGIKPLDHQKLMANFMVSHPRSFNLSDMGTMKTLATLWAADWLMQQYPKGECRALVVAKLSTLAVVWKKEIDKNLLGRRTCEIIHGSQATRVERLRKPADFYIINFDGVGIGAHTRKRFDLAGFSRELADRMDIQIIIVDESRDYHDSRTKRHRVAKLVFGSRPYMWFLTGTPTPNGPLDAYGQAKLVNGAFGESWTSYRNRVMAQITSFKWVPRAGANEAARKLLSPAIRFDIRDVWDGPPITTQQREVELTEDQRKHMKALKRDLMVEIAGGKTISAMNEAAARAKFMQISLGAIYDAEHKWHPVDAAPRLSELKQVLRDAPGKVLIFVPLTSIVNLLYAELKEWSREIVNGDTTAGNRQRIFSAFQQTDNPRLLIADPGCMAHGLDLYAAQTVVWYGPTDKTELYLQANKRAHRPGQRYPVTVVQIVSTTLEKEIFRRLESNESLQGALLQMVREGKL
jgi:SNF2 family DNA or RNA helicase